MITAFPRQFRFRRARTRATSETTKPCFSYGEKRLRVPACRRTSEVIRQGSTLLVGALIRMVSEPSRISQTFSSKRRSPRFTSGSLCMNSRASSSRSVFRIIKPSSTSRPDLIKRAGQEHFILVLSHIFQMFWGMRDDLRFRLDRIIKSYKKSLFQIRFSQFKNCGR